MGAFHDSMLLYGMALNETLMNGGDPTDGYVISRRMWNRTFQGKKSIKLQLFSGVLEVISIIEAIIVIYSLY